MLRPNAFAKVAGPAAILSAVGWTLWLWPAHFLWVFPASGTLFIWFSWSGDKEGLGFLKTIPNLQVVYIDTPQIADAALAPFGLRGDDGIGKSPCACRERLAAPQYGLA